MPPNKHVIKLSGDFVEVTQGFKKLSDSIKNISDKKYDIKFDKKFIKSIQDDMQKHQDVIQQRSQRLSSLMQQSYKQLQEAYEKATDPERIKQLEKRFQVLNREFSRTNQQMNMMQQVGGTMGDRGGFGGRFGGALGRLGITGAFLGGAYMTAYGLGATRRTIAEPGIQLRGLGIAQGAGQMEALREIGGRFGFGGAATLQQAQMLARASGPGAVQGQVAGLRGIEFFQQFQRATGLQAGELTPMLASLRRAGFEGPQSLKKLQDMYANAVAMGFDKSRAIKFMEEQTNYLQSVSEQTTVNADALSQFTNLMMTGNRFFAADPRRAAEARAGLERAVTQREGFGATAVFRAARRLAPGMSPIEIMGMLQRNLFSQQGFFGRFGQRGVSEILEQTGQMLGAVDFREIEEGSEQWIIFARQIQKQFGFKYLEMAEEMIKATKEATMTNDEFAKKFSQARKDIKNNAQQNMQNLDGAILRQQAALEEAMSDLGDNLNALTTKLGGWGHMAMSTMGIVSSGLTALAAIKYLRIGKAFSTVGRAATALTGLNLATKVPLIGRALTGLATGLRALVALTPQLLAIAGTAAAGFALGTFLEKKFKLSKKIVKGMEDIGLMETTEEAKERGVRQAGRTIAERLIEQKRQEGGGIREAIMETQGRLVKMQMQGEKGAVEIQTLILSVLQEMLEEEKKKQVPPKSRFTPNENQTPQGANK